MISTGVRGRYPLSHDQDRRRRLVGDGLGPAAERPDPAQLTAAQQGRRPRPVRRARRWPTTAQSLLDLPPRRRPAAPGRDYAIDDMQHAERRASTGGQRTGDARAHRDAAEPSNPTSIDRGKADPYSRAISTARAISTEHQA